MTSVQPDSCTTEREIWTKRSSMRLPTVALGVTETWSGNASYNLSTVYCDAGPAEELPDVGWGGVGAHNQMTPRFLGSRTFAQSSSRSHDSASIAPHLRHVWSRREGNGHVFQKEAHSSCACLCRRSLTNEHQSASWPFDAMPKEAT